MAPMLIAVAHEKVAENQETDWDFALDCLVTHGPAGVVNTVTGVCGLAAMTWLYGVAWHQPMADSVAWARTSITDALPSSSKLMGGIAKGAREIDRLMPASSAPAMRASASAPGSTSGTAAAAIPRAAPAPAGHLASSAPSGPAATAAPVGDAAFVAMMAARRAETDALRSEGPRVLATGDYKRAAELCQSWSELELGNPDAWRCLGKAEQGLGKYQDAINAFRKAKQYAPTDNGRPCRCPAGLTTEPMSKAVIRTTTIDVTMSGEIQTARVFSSWRALTGTAPPGARVLPAGDEESLLT